jgi:predicted AAA+ superfamily ATPase
MTIQMERSTYSDLLAWKRSARRKPLLLQGARQVGKSHLLESFGRNEFKDYHVFNFELDSRLNTIFARDLSPERIVFELSIHLGRKIDSSNDLVIFDEIQECPRAITSLKYFCEKFPQLALCCAGSLLGVKLSSESFPVGKVKFLDLHPLCFEEFLLALDDQILLELIPSALETGNLPEIAHKKLWERLREYFVTGGMPQVVSSYVSMQEDRAEAMRQARVLQKGIIEGYYKDFAKHSGKTNSIHIVSVFENVPMQLAKNIEGSVKRYKFRDVIERKRSFIELQGPIDWLEKAGLLMKVKICNKSELPLEAFCRDNFFKLLIFDIGLLGCMLDLSPETILQQNYGITKGYFAENYVAQEFVAAGYKRLYSWTERNSEIEFLRVIDGKVVPVEVKAGTRTQAKSLKQFLLKYAPEMAIKLTANPLKINENEVIQNIPLYLAGRI